MISASIKQGIQRTTRYASIVGMYVLLVMTLLTTCDVIGRSLLRRPIIGAIELSEYMLVAIVLLGIAYTQQVGGHVRIHLFVSRLRPVNQLVIDSVVTLIALIFFLLIMWQSGVEAVQSLNTGRVSSILHVPMYPFKFLISVGAFLLCLEFLLKLITSVKEAIEHKVLVTKEKT